jgi:hypothetical protein
MCGTFERTLRREAEEEVPNGRMDLTFSFMKLRRVLRRV